MSSVERVKKLMAEGKTFDEACEIVKRWYKSYVKLLRKGKAA